MDTQPEYVYACTGCCAHWEWPQAVHTTIEGAISEAVERLVGVRECWAVILNEPDHEGVVAIVGKNFGYEEIARIEVMV